MRLELFLARAQRSAEKSLLSAQVATAVQVVVVADVCRVSGVRRIIEVRELGPVADGVIRQREIFAYRPHRDLPQWSVVNRTSVFRESLEKQPVPFVFSKLPDTLELPIEVSYREAAESLVR